jgi:hypothetical protein
MKCYCLVSSLGLTALCATTTTLAFTPADTARHTVVTPQDIQAPPLPQNAVEAKIEQDDEELFMTFRSLPDLGNTKDAYARVLHTTEFQHVWNNLSGDS